MRRICVFLFLCLLSAQANAQIEYTADDFVRYYFRSDRTVQWNSSDTVGARALEADSGANKAWDLTGRLYTLPSPPAFGSVLLPYSTNMPLANDTDFASATYVLIDTLNPQYLRYEYYQINDSGFWQLGTSEDSVGFYHKIERYWPPLMQLRFPLLYGTSWRSTSTYYYLKYNEIYEKEIDGKVDGYGSLLLPVASPMDAVRTTVRSTISYSGNASSDYTYLWFTKSDFWAMALSDNNHNLTNGITFVQPVKSSVKPTDISTSSVWPEYEFAAKRITLHYTLQVPGDVRISIFDILGNSVQTIHDRNAEVGEHSTAIDVRGLTSGVYFARITTPTYSVSQRIFIDR